MAIGDVDQVEVVATPAHAECHVNGGANLDDAIAILIVTIGTMSPSMPQGEVDVLVEVEIGHVGQQLFRHERPGS